MYSKQLACFFLDPAGRVTIPSVIEYPAGCYYFTKAELCVTSRAAFFWFADDFQPKVYRNKFLMKPVYYYYLLHSRQQKLFLQEEFH
jgi:hypothetical protein